MPIFCICCFYIRKKLTDISKITVYLYFNVTKNSVRIRFMLKIKRIAHWVFYHLALNRRSSLRGLKGYCIDFVVS